MYNKLHYEQKAFVILSVFVARKKDEPLSH